MKQFIGHYSQSSRYASKELVYRVIANTKEEALGFCLESEPGSVVDDWIVYGDEPDSDCSYGKPFCLMADYWEA
ncbi:MAG: hypothetical protein ACN2B6_00330 [Rickettsiales bacterium]